VRKLWEEIERRGIKGKDVEIDFGGEMPSCAFLVDREGYEHRGNEKHAGGVFQAGDDEKRSDKSAR
jgi:hypothetical protein